ncbi:pap2 domain protein [Botrytis cinerea]
MSRIGRNTGGLTSKPGWIGAVARFWEKSYAPDYVGFVLLLTAYVLIEFLQEPFHRMFFINNINIQYPHALVERVPVGWNLIYAGVIPCITLAIWLGISRANLHKCHVTILGFFIGLVLTSFITDVIKNAVGRPRPDLISRCKPTPETPENKLVTIHVCTETDHHTLHDGWRSFPSGHSSFAFAGLGYLAFFFAGQTHVFRPRTDLGGHDVYDVTCGSILGISLAYFSYRRYFPRLHSSKCHEPYPSREAAFNQGFGKIKNDEETEVGRAREFDVSDNESDAS